MPLASDLDALGFLIRFCESVEGSKNADATVVEPGVPDHGRHECEKRKTSLYPIRYVHLLKTQRGFSTVCAIISLYRTPMPPMSEFTELIDVGRFLQINCDKISPSMLRSYPLLVSNGEI